MKIGNVELKNNLFLSPMAGYTDAGFRKVCRDFGCGLSYTEMVSAKALAYNSVKTKSLLKTTKEETPKAVQIFGHEPNVMAKICSSDVLKDFDIIDINMGCPAPKIVANGDGSALLKNINLAQKIVEECVKSTKKPVTVKYRLGWDKDTSVEFAKMFESAGASAIALHGRTREQMYSGIALYQAIGQVKDSVKIPVIANGDIKDLESLKTAKKITNADAFMIGRGALGSPWIFSTLLGKTSVFDKYDVILEHINIMLKFYPERYVVTNMRKHLDKYLKDISNLYEKKHRLLTSDSVEEVKQILMEIFEKN